MSPIPLSTEQLLKESEERYDLAQKAAKIGSWDWNIITGGLKWSDGIYEMFGLKPQEFGATYEAFLNSVHPDDRKFVSDSVDASVKDENTQYDIEHRIVWPDGTVRWVSEKGRVFRDSSGKPIRMLGMVQDITARKEAEAKVLELNEILRILNQTMRHDVMNDLTVVQGNIDNYLEDQKGTDLKELLQNVYTAIDRSKNFIEKMKELEAAVSSGKGLKPYQIRNVVDEVKKDFPEMKFQIQGEGEILADEAVYSVLKNLFQNAKIHGQADQITITISQNDKGLVVKISDNGKGIPEEAKKDLFQQGFAYGETGHTGLGLYIVKKTIERYGGKVSAEDNQPKGTTFILQFPHS